MSQTSTSRPERLPLRLKLLFSTGDLSTSIPLAILMFFQLYFLTDVAGISARSGNLLPLLSPDQAEGMADLVHDDR